MINKKIIICSTIRNVEKDLKDFFIKLDQITSNFDDYFIILVQSNSNDNTAKSSETFLKNRKGIIINKNLDLSLYRTQRLEICRNEFLSYIKKDTLLRTYDFLIVMDADGINSMIKYEYIYNSINSSKNWSAIFANQKYIYYDIWTLRIKNYIDFDCFQKIKEEAQINNSNLKKVFNNYFTKYFFIKNVFKDRFIKVDSAFGGLGIYQLNKILDCHYDSKGGSQCEHVGLNEQLNKKYGDLYIDKQLINSSGISKHTINGILCSKFNIFAKRFLKIIKQTIK
tara:strand:+ start:1960 stop:2805 length:846 start_codon:yes stop_codon:yes gene_type:complete